MTVLPLVREAWLSGLRPEPSMTVATWADAHRVLPPQSAEPGRWRTDRVPYLREIMECLSVSNPVETVVFQASAQVGKTEAGLNWLGYCIHHAPGTILLAWPSEDTIRRNVSERIDPLIEHCPELKDLVAEKKSRDAGNTTNKKAFPGGALHIVSAQSAIALRSLPVRYLFLDEVDAFPPTVGEDGDPVKLAMRRTQTFRGRAKIFMCSTPTVRSFSRIERAYLESDQRVFEVPCPHCGEYSEIRWADIRWPEGQPQQAAWWCPGCGVEVAERHKHGMVAAGRWRATAPGAGRAAGFRVNALVSPFASWGDLARDFLEVRKDHARLREFVNNALGETWEAEGEALDAAGLASRREAWGAGLPAGAVTTTCGCDIQKDRIEATFAAWGAGEECWILEHVVLWGDPSKPDIWRDLDELLSRTWDHPQYDIPPLPVAAVAIDSGYLSPAVTSYCRGKEKRRIWAIKGSSIAAAPLWPRGITKKNGRAAVFSIGSTAGKDLIYARLQNTGAGPGVIHFSSDLPVTYFEQLTAEKVRTRHVKGHPVREYYKQDSARNEALDCLVYATAALYGLKNMKFDLDREANRLATTANPRSAAGPSLPVAVPPPPPSPLPVAGVAPLPVPPPKRRVFARFAGI